MIEGSGGLVINEVDYDSVGTDTLEFIEIYNPTQGTLSLAGTSLVFFNGSNSTVYRTIDLTDGGSLGPQGYLVVGSSLLLSQIDGAVELPLPGAQDNIQNGAPDAVGLLSGAEVLDVLSYEGETSGEVAGVGFVDFVETSPTSAADNNDSPASVCRVADTGDAADDWAECAPTPGGPNGA